MYAFLNAPLARALKMVPATTLRKINKEVELFAVTDLKLKMQ